LFDSVNKRVLISKHVVFEERKGWNLKQNMEEHQPEILEWEDNEEYVSETLKNILRRMLWRVLVLKKLRTKIRMPRTYLHVLIFILTLLIVLIMRL